LAGTSTPLPPGNNTVRLLIGRNQTIHDWANVTGADLDLTTADELLLLAIEPRTGRIAARPPHSLPFALAGAMLMDLIHDRQITVVDDKIVAGADTGEPWCDAILARIRRMPIPQGIGYWVIAVGAPQFRAQDRVTWRLIERGLVTLDVRRVLVVFSSMRYVVALPGVRDALRARVAAAMATNESVSAQFGSLIAMAASCGILHRLIAGQQRRAARQRLLAILQADEFATGEAVTAAQFVSAATFEVYSAVCAGGHGAGGGGHGGGHGGH
jgi:Golgi phosphoprotein 3 (GPP34)